MKRKSPSMLPSSSEPIAMVPAPVPFLLVMLDRRHAAHTAAMHKELDNLIMGFRPLDFRGCFHMIRKFSGLSEDEILTRSGASARHITYLEARGAVNVEIYYRLRDIAHQCYLPMDIEKWFDREARIKESRRRPTRTETLGGERK